MKYKLRQELWTFGDDFTIEDEAGNPCYFVDGKMLSIGDKLSFQDMDGNELARIQQVALTIGKRHQILRNGKVFATVKKGLFTFFREAFTVEDPASGDFDIQGDAKDHEFEFIRNGETIASVSKEYFAMSDTYGVEINDGEDHVLILAIAVVIDMCCHPG